MKSTLGQPRRLTDAQVKFVLEWNERRQEWRARRAKHPTLKALAKELSSNEHTIKAAIRRGRDYVAPPVWNLPVGRPPSLRTPEVLQRIHSWHDEHLALRKLRKEIGTQAAIARGLGVSSGVIQTAIRCGGDYKQPSPDQREAELARSHAKLHALSERNLY